MLFAADRTELSEPARDLLEWTRSLAIREEQFYSQNGEDGITLAIFERIGAGTKFYVEFGVQDGMQCMTRILR